MTNFDLMRFFAPQKNMTDDYFLAAFIDNDIFKERPDFNYGSSYHVLGARLIGLPYADYLLWCVKNFKATLGGKRGYCYPMFKDIADCQKFCTMLNNKFKDFMRKSGLFEEIINR